MCWNSTVSLQTFSLAVYGAILTTISNYSPFSYIVFMMSFSIMQLLEAGIWETLSIAMWNRTLSMLGLFIIGCQPMLAILTMNPGVLRRSMLLSYAAFVLLYIFLVLPNVVWRTTVAPNGHLRWEWLRPPLVMILAWLFFLIAPLYLRDSKRKVAFWFVLISALLVLWKYYDTGTWGSLWCWISNLAWIYIITDILIFKNLCRL
jgi:hypothetical protein